MVLMTSSVPTANHVTALFATTTCSTVVGVAANRPAPFEAGRFGFSKVPDITFSLRCQPALLSLLQLEFLHCPMCSYAVADVPRPPAKGRFLPEPWGGLSIIMRQVGATHVPASPWGAPFRSGARLQRNRPRRDGGAGDEEGGDRRGPEVGYAAGSSGSRIVGGTR
jgi:hypothetical protein